MAGKGHVVAWISKAEWEQVLEYMYSRDSKLQRDALHQIYVWKSRFGKKMPLAMECTADLVRCKILDVNGGMGEQDLIFLYGLALVRFVNIITEGKQKTLAIPLRRLANELNIPEWVINLRHRVTHQKMPNLSSCRKGWDFVMDWLKREYWSRQLGNASVSQLVSEDENSEDLEDMLPLPAVEEQKETTTGKLREALRCYSIEQFKIFQELQNIHKTKKSWRITSNLERNIAQIKELAHQSSLSCRTAVDNLLDDGCMIPTAKQLITLKIEEQEDAYVNLFLPRTLLRFWQPLLRALHCHFFTQELLEKMFCELGRCQESNTLARGHYLSCWIAEILTANHKAEEGKPAAPSRTQATVKSKRKLFSHRVYIQWKQLLQNCLKFPCQTTPQLLRLMFSYMKPRLPVSTQEKLLCLCSIYIQNDDTDVSVDYSNQPIYTVESLQWKIKQESKAKVSNHWDRSSEDEDEEMSENMEDEEMITETYEEECIEMINVKTAAERRAALEDSAWRVSSEYVKWKDFPLGRVPGQTQDPNCLLIDGYSTMSVLEPPESEARKNGYSIPVSAQNIPSSENMFWSLSELNRIKAGLQLF